VNLDLHICVVGMASKSDVNIIETSSKVHFSGFHQMDGLASNRPEQMAEEEEHGQPFVIGVAGGAASGKTTVCDMIMQQLHDQRAVVVNQDSFYHNVNEVELVRVHDYNFDHPDAFDTEQLLSSMEKLRKGQAVDIPNYDFKSYKNNVFPPRRVNPSDVIILEGILIFHDPRVRDLMNMKIFVDAGLSHTKPVNTYVVKSVAYMRRCTCICTHEGNTLVSYFTSWRYLCRCRCASSEKDKTRYC
jgi:uridine kinase